MELNFMGFFLNRSELLQNYSIKNGLMILRLKKKLPKCAKQKMYIVYKV